MRQRVCVTLRGLICSSSAISSLEYPSSISCNTCRSCGVRVEERSSIVCRLLADESGIQSAVIDLSDTRHSFLDCVWAGGIGKGDWQPDRYAAWFNEAKETNFWGNH